jgi:hypothetical protein
MKLTAIRSNRKLARRLCIVGAGYLFFSGVFMLADGYPSFSHLFWGPKLVKSVSLSLEAKYWVMRWNRYQSHIRNAEFNHPDWKWLIDEYGANGRHPGAAPLGLMQILGNGAMGLVPYKQSLNAPETTKAYEALKSLGGLVPIFETNS